MPIGFMLIPHTLSLKYGLYSKETDVVFHWQSYLCLALLIFLVNHYFLKSDEYFHQMVISMCEEFLFRFVIYKVLRNNYSRLWSIIISSLLLSYARQATHQNPTGYSIFNFGDKIWFGVRYRWTLDLQSLSINYLI